MSTPHHDPDENLPEWLKDLRRKQNDPEPPAAPEDAAAHAAAEPEAEPDWLADIRRRHREEGGLDAERSLSDTQPNKPFRLESRRLQTPEAEAAAFAAEPETHGEVPDWLEDDEPPAPATTPAFSELPDDEEAPLELPSWLQAPASSTPAFYAGEEDDLLPPADMENAGPLAGLSGILPAEPEVAKIGKAPVFSTRLEVSEAQQRHATVLQALIASEAQPASDSAAQQRRPARLLTLLLSAGLLLAALWPLLGRGLQAPRPEPEALPEGTAMFNSIDVLPSGAAVLVIFDVQPAFYGEVRAAASPVIGHLLDRQARLVFVSTQPSGPALAERLLQQDFAQLPLIATQDYISLGYLPGGMAGMRSFASNPALTLLSAPAMFVNPWSRPALQNITTLDDFALVLLVVSEAEDGRAWVEQATPELSEGLYVVSSAQAAPLLHAYLDTQPAQIAALVAGVRGGAHYERLRARDSLSQRYWDSYSYQLGAALMVIVLGGLYGRVIHSQAEKPQGSSV
ncbi:MAG: hypothetical protein KF821_05895 [Anaerolineales bacterium]|nr:hypothetical protein [Anaerolineales bacterium]